MLRRLFFHRLTQCTHICSACTHGRGAWLPLATSHLGVPPFCLQRIPLVWTKYREQMKHANCQTTAGPSANDSYALNQHVHPEDVHLTSIRNLCRAAGVMRAVLVTFVRTPTTFVLRRWSSMPRLCIERLTHGRRTRFGGEGRTRP